MIDSDNYHGITGKRKRTDQTPIQFFVRSLSKTETLVIRGYSNDSIEITKNKIRMITGMPEDHQRLIYNGKQLSCQSETLAFYNIQNDTTIHLVGKMPTYHLQTWKITTEIISKISMIFNSDYVCHSSDLKDMTMLMKEFTFMILNKNAEEACHNIQFFISSSAPADLVILYMSRDNTKKSIADKFIHRFINSMMSIDLPKKRYSGCARLILEFCKLLRRVVGLEDPLYRFCRSIIMDIVEAVGIARCKKNVADELLALNDVFMIVREVVVADLSRELELSMGSIESTGLSLISIVRDFTEYMCLVRALLQQPFDSLNGEAVYNREYIESLHRILSDLHIMLYDLLDKIERCLRKLEDQLRSNNEAGMLIVSWWSHYLVILKELSNINSELFNNSEVFWQKLNQQKFSLCFLIAMFANSFDDYRWIIEHKEVTNFEVRRHLTMMMLEEARFGNKEKSYEMLIDRSVLLDVSFEYIVYQDPALLRGDLLIQFKHKEATGPGVLREWFFLVFREMFNPHKALFVACPNDRRRFFPNSGKLLSLLCTNLHQTRINFSH
uniref:HECT-type E3 ubiquitin transferase n=1 Tax=Solanum tuberosum TaxID=4113 RepID=M1DDN0_SOLTU